MLAEGQELPASNCDHALTGNWKGYRECHIEPEHTVICIFKINTVQEIVPERCFRHSTLPVFYTFSSSTTLSFRIIFFSSREI